MRILGLSAYYHDSAAALVEDGVILAAAQEERFTRRKHDACFPAQAINYCLREAKCKISDVDNIIFYEKPLLKFDRILKTYLAFAPKGFTQFRKSLPVWIGQKLFQKQLLIKEIRRIDPLFDGAKLLFSEHHLSHAASAFYPSPFSDAVVLTMDGVGEWATTSIALGNGNKLEIIKEQFFPHSLGFLYSAFTLYTGFKVNSGEYKVMGLAPYGTPKYKNIIFDKLVDIKSDGSFRLNQDYFSYCTGLTMINDKFAALFGEPVRTPKEKLTQFHMDIAASVQAVTEEIILCLTRSLADETGAKNICMAGGVALNCVANSKVLRSNSFKNIFIQPAAGDAGGALGAAMVGCYIYNKLPRIVKDGQDAMQGSYLGPEYDQSDIETRLAKIGAVWSVFSEESIIDETAKSLAEGKAVGWMQGRMEFGPRALGGRSILGDPRAPNMQRILNLKVKYRESFRPFAPSVLREELEKWFELDCNSPYMLLVAPVRNELRLKNSTEEDALFGIDKLNVLRSSIPAVTHVDYSARIQTVHSDTNPKYYSLINKFKSLTGCPIVINTSFNVRGEPIVNTPEDAFRCFMGTGIEVLVIGNCFLRKEDQDPSLALNYEEAFELD